MGSEEVGLILGDRLGDNEALVWRAQLGDLPVVLKIIPGGGDMRSYADRVARFEHRAVVPFWSVQSLPLPGGGEGVGIVMPWLDGEPLGVRLVQETFSLPEAKRIGRDVLDGLFALHEAGLVHGDAHPGNVYLLRGGGAALIDVVDAHLNQWLPCEWTDHHRAVDLAKVLALLEVVLGHTEGDSSRRFAWVRGLAEGGDPRAVWASLT